MVRISFACTFVLFVYHIWLWIYLNRIIHALVCYAAIVLWMSDFWDVLPQIWPMFNLPTVIKRSQGCWIWENDGCSGGYSSSNSQRLVFFFLDMEDGAIWRKTIVRLSFFFVCVWLCSVSLQEMSSDSIIPGHLFFFSFFGILFVWRL